MRALLIAAIVVVGCGDGDGAQMQGAGGAGQTPQLILGVPDSVAGVNFEPLIDGASIEADGCFAVRSFGMGDKLTGYIDATNAAGDVAGGQWDPLLLYCLADGYCQQLPVCFSLEPLGQSLDGMSVTITGSFSGNGITLPFDVRAVLRE